MTKDLGLVIVLGVSSDILLMSVLCYREPSYLAGRFEIAATSPDGDTTDLVCDIIDQ